MMSFSSPLTFSMAAWSTHLFAWPINSWAAPSSRASHWYVPGRSGFSGMLNRSIWSSLIPTRGKVKLVEGFEGGLLRSLDGDAFLLVPPKEKSGHPWPHIVPCGRGDFLALVVGVSVVEHPVEADRGASGPVGSARPVWVLGRAASRGRPPGTTADASDTRSLCACAGHRGSR